MHEEEKLEAVNLARKDERRETRLEMIESFIKAGTDTLTLMEATGLVLLFHHFLPQPIQKITHSTS